MCGMSEDQPARYDRIADGYAAHWAPVIRPAAIRLLDDLASLLPAGSPHLLDIGTGTGALAIEALERWPSTQVTGIDASSEMVRWALGEADRRLPTSARQRLSTAVAFADRLPFPDASFDLAMSSFVLQLVPNRAAALREARRVLRPGAPFGYVTWLRADDGIDPPDRVLDDAPRERQDALPLGMGDRTRVHEPPRRLGAVEPHARPAEDPEGRLVDPIHGLVREDLEPSGIPDTFHRDPFLESRIPRGTWRLGPRGRTSKKYHPNVLHALARVRAGSVEVLSGALADSERHPAGGGLGRGRLPILLETRARHPARDGPRVSKQGPRCHRREGGRYAKVVVRMERV